MEAAGLHCAFPREGGVRHALDPVEVIAARPMPVLRSRREGRGLDDRNQSRIRTRQHLDHGHVVMAADHKFRAVTSKARPHFLGIDQALVAGTDPAGRMMDHHDAEQPLARQLVENLAQPLALRPPDLAGRHEGMRRYRGRNADHRDTLASAHEGEGVLSRDIAVHAVAAHVVAPVQERMMRGGTDISVMIAGDDADIRSLPQRLQEVQPGLEFGGETDIDQIAGDGDVIGPRSLKIRHEQINRGNVEPALPAASPVQHAKGAFSGEFGKARTGQRPEMRIGEVGKDKHEGFLISPRASAEAGHRAARGPPPRPRPPRASTLSLLINYWRRITHGMTLGVRAIVLTDTKQVLLVRHTYVSGWHLPGGGVDAGETAVEAVERELREEAGLLISDAPRFHGLFFNQALGRDHIAVFVVSGFRPDPAPARSREIAETGFFPLAVLPEGTTASTRRRLEELTLGQPTATHW